MPDDQASEHPQQPESSGSPSDAARPGSEEPAAPAEKSDATQQAGAGTGGGESAEKPAAEKPAVPADREERMRVARERAAAAKAAREGGGAADAQPPAAGVPARTSASKVPAAKERPGRDGGAELVAAGAGGHAIVIARPAPLAPALPQMSRRNLLRLGFWTALGAMLVGIVATTVNSIYPRKIARLGGKFVVGKVDDLSPGVKRETIIQVPDVRNPLEPLEAKLFMVRFNAEQAARNPGAQEGAIMALWRKCPHLGCTVPFKPEFSFQDPRSGATYSGWFRCPCHGSTYSDAGVKVFGPAPRSMDSFALTIEPDGSLTVDLDKVQVGKPDNGAYSVQPPSA